MRLAMMALAWLTLAGCTREPATAEAQEPRAEGIFEFYSTATPRDGDDLLFSVRMHGFDAPERDRHCRDAQGADVNVGNAARLALRDMVHQSRVDCVLIGHDEQDERMVARCSVDGRDIGAAMVAQGWARDWPRYSGGRYADAEAQARATRRGVWGLQCPADVWSNREY